MSEKKLTFTADESHANVRLDKALGSVPGISSRSRAQFLIDKDLVRINSKSVKSSYILQMGDQVQISLPEEKKDILLPFDFKLDVVFEDKDVIVVNKPSGLVVHPASGHEQDTLVNALLNHTKDLSMRFGEERPGIVHRLDKETSGLMVIAKNDAAHEGLAEQFKERSIHRIYHAVCFKNELKKSGTIQSYLNRHHVERKKIASIRDEKLKVIIRNRLEDFEAGKWSVTHYEVLASNHNFNYVQLKLETGRTHQIRVHLSELGSPLVGDVVYGSDKKILSVGAEYRKLIEPMDRFALHAKELGFVHPKTGKTLSFSVDWPEPYKTALKKLIEF